MAKGKVPTRDELLAFIRDSATPVGKREIARAWNLKGDQRIELKQLLRELRDAGEVAADRAKTFRDPGALSDVAVLEIVRVDNDGHLIAVPRRHDEEMTAPRRASRSPRRPAAAAPRLPSAIACWPTSNAAATPPTRRASSAGWAAGRRRSSACTKNQTAGTAWAW